MCASKDWLGRGADLCVCPMGDPVGPGDSPSFPRSALECCPGRFTSLSRDGDGNSQKGVFSRDGKWSVSIAVGKKRFVGKVKAQLGARAQGRDVIAVGGGYVLNDLGCPYTSDFGVENDALSFQSAHFWDV